MGQEGPLIRVHTVVAVVRHLALILLHLIGLRILRCTCKVASCNSSTDMVVIGNI